MPSGFILCGLLKPFRLAILKPGCCEADAVPYDAESIFFAVSFICAGVLSPSLSRLVGRSLFRKSFQAYAAMHLEAVSTPEPE